jgi:2-polyprenyl-6-hydroxyphenyl methylase/3-demethylubiquinone-9 3-methyltransferase
MHDKKQKGAAHEIESGSRFGFGQNWSAFNRQSSNEALASAIASITQIVGKTDLTNFEVLDAGSGSGLFSQAFRALGAEVVSFDYDEESVAATASRRGAMPSTDSWKIVQGSLLDRQFMEKLGQFEIVYCWGVAHHTGDMWTALDLLGQRVRLGGLLVVSIYNDQGKPSRRWLRVKQLYNRHIWLRYFLLAATFIRLWGVKFLQDLIAGRPLHSWRRYAPSSRGMSAWHDLVDWTGGLPFEVAKPETVLEFYLKRGFVLRRLATNAGGIGCNEYVMRNIGIGAIESGTTDVTTASRFFPA